MIQTRQTKGRTRAPKVTLRYAGLVSLLILSVTLAADPGGKKSREKWVAPAKFKKIKNPVASSAKSIAAGKVVYVKNCLVCHGTTGIGDGKQAKDLKVPVGNLRTDIAKQTDGELYFKTSKGREPMPEFVKTLKPAERWHVINFIRTLVAKPAASQPSAKKSGAGKSANKQGKAPQSGSTAKDKKAKPKKS